MGVMCSHWDPLKFPSDVFLMGEEECHGMNCKYLT
jgi:hypothetical protein